MKRIVICMDGTWQSLYQDRATNIGIIARSVAHEDIGPNGPIPQVVIYTYGVGSTIGALEKPSFFGGITASLNRALGGAFGEGLDDGIVDTYLRLVFAYEPGDEIYIFGFSRGAFAARRLAGFINAAGIVSRRFAEKARDGYRLYYDAPGSTASADERRAYDDAEAAFRRLYGKGGRHQDGSRYQIPEPPKVHYLGVFDTVVQIGAGDVAASLLPGNFNRKRYGFRNLEMCGNVLSARHAVAIDECRLGFPSTQWSGLDEANEGARKRGGADPHYEYYQQQWFVGMHSDIGGGIDSKLPALSLKWIAEGAQRMGLKFYDPVGADVSPLTEAMREADLAFESKIPGIPFFETLLQPVNYPWRPRKVWTGKGKPSEADAKRFFNEAVIQRAMSPEMRPRYLPPGLKPFKPYFAPPKGKPKRKDAEA